MATGQLLRESRGRGLARPVPLSAACSRTAPLDLLRSSEDSLGWPPAASSVRA